jgi:hypothetical protein
LSTQCQQKTKTTAPSTWGQIRKWWRS